MFVGFSIMDVSDVRVDEIKYEFCLIDERVNSEEKGEEGSCKGEVHWWCENMILGSYGCSRHDND